MEPERDPVDDQSMDGPLRVGAKLEGCRSGPDFTNDDVLERPGEPTAALPAGKVTGN